MWENEKYRKRGRELEFDVQGGATRKGGCANTHIHTRAKSHTWSASAHIFRSRICMSNSTEILGGVVINSAKELVLEGAFLGDVYLVFFARAGRFAFSFERTSIRYLKLRCDVSDDEEISDSFRTLVIPFPR